MKAVVSLKVEIIEGPDKGYVLEEKNRIVELNRAPYDYKPYQVTVEFVTPDMYREWREMQ